MLELQDQEGQAIQLPSRFQHLPSWVQLAHSIGRFPPHDNQRQRKPEANQTQQTDKAGPREERELLAH